MDMRPIRRMMSRSAPFKVAGYDVETPWWQSIVENVKDLLEFNKLPPLQTTSTPSLLRTLGTVRHTRSLGPHRWRFTRGDPILLFGGKALTKKSPELHDKIFVPTVDIEAYQPKPQAAKMGGGGGGGDRSPDPASKGRAPRFAKEQFAPPAVVLRAPDAKLLVEPTVIGPRKSSCSNMSQIGDPMGVLGPLRTALIRRRYGSGHGGGVGSGDGGGVGPGSGGGFGGGAFKVGGGVSPPSVIYRVEPGLPSRAQGQVSGHGDDQRGG